MRGTYLCKRYTLPRLKSSLSDFGEESTVYMWEGLVGNEEY